MPTIKPAPWEGHPVISESVETLPVKLTEDEVLTRGRALALQTSAIVDLESQQKDELRALKERHKSDMSAAVLERHRLTKAVNSGKEPRPVKCVKIAQYDMGIVYTVRTDTVPPEQVGQRRIRSDEQQVKLASVIRLVVDKDSGELSRDDGGSMSELPFVQPDQCQALRCASCDALHGTVHADECEHHRAGTSSAVQREHCADQECSRCGAILGRPHARTCPHARA